VTNPKLKLCDLGEQFSANYGRRSYISYSRREVGRGAAVLLVAAVIVVIAGMIRRNATEMAVTSRRVVIKTGLAARKTIEMH
jgi:hypothetical protein